MPLRLRIDRGFTIGPLQTQYWNWNWFGEGGGPNKGPVIFAADPKGQPRPTAREVLVTYDIAKCRGAPSEPNAPEVFYEFKIRNESNVTVPFRLEIILFSDLPIQDFH